MASEKEVLIDDNVVIPEEIRQMTKEELAKAIEALEKELGLKKRPQPRF